MTIEERLNKIKDNHREETADHDTRERLANEMAKAVNDYIPNPFPFVNHWLLCQEGMMSLGQLLSKEQVVDVINHMSDKLVYNSHIPKGDGTRRPLSQSPGENNCYDLEDILTCPHLLEMALRKDILKIVSSYLGCVPTLYSMNMWESSRSTSSGIRSYHRDLDSMRFLALFIYLVDVDDNTGPHIFVKCTHDQKIMEKMAGESVDRFFPPNPFPYPPFEHLVGQNITTLTGSAGSGYLLDTFGIHKGSENLQKRRLVLWLRFATDRAPPSLEQIPKPFSSSLVEGRNIEFDETNKYITRVLLDWHK